MVMYCQGQTDVHHPPKYRQYGVSGRGRGTWRRTETGSPPAWAPVTGYCMGRGPRPAGDIMMMCAARQEVPEFRANVHLAPPAIGLLRVGKPSMDSSVARVELPGPSFGIPAPEHERSAPPV
jgi:hypothetical protein